MIRLGISGVVLLLVFWGGVSIGMVYQHGLNGTFVKHVPCPGAIGPTITQLCERWSDGTYRLRRP